MLPLLQEIKQADAEIERVNNAKPVDGGPRSLRSTELEARNIDGFGMNGVSLLRDLKLPAFNEPSRLLWPPPTPVLTAEMVAPIIPHPMDRWWEHQSERKAQADAEAARVANYYRRQQREKEDMENARARAEHERRRQAAST